MSQLFGETFKVFFLFFASYCPLCNKEILKNIIASSLKLGQLIEGDE